MVLGLCRLGASAEAAALAQPGASQDGIKPKASPQLLSHYDYPPFATTPKQGLTLDWLQWVNERLPADWEPLQMQMLPRKRLDLAMSQADWMGVVPWVSPQFFSDAAMQRYVWSAPVMEDGDVVLSRRSQPVHYQNPESLYGLTLGGVAGHVYAEIDALVAAGLLQREDAPNTGSNLQKLLRGRVDVVFLPRSGLPWWRRQIEAFDQLVFIAEQPRNSFQRRMLLAPRLPKPWREFLLQAALDMPSDPGWQLALSRYGLQTLALKKHSEAHTPTWG